MTDTLISQIEEAYANFIILINSGGQTKEEKEGSHSKSSNIIAS